VIKVLVVDDDPINVELLEGYLKEDGFQSIKAFYGDEGWNLLQENPDISLILLDRMMPKLDGITFMEMLNESSLQVPVIMQTAAADHNSMIQGISSGVYYYLTKPFSKDLLSSIVHSALNDGRYKRDLMDELKKNQDAISLVSQVNFKFKSVKEATDISYFLANMYIEPEQVVLGILEVLTNAVEHGNLNIGFQGKGEFLIKGQLSSEIDRRLKLPENQNKFVSVSLTKSPQDIVLRVKDCGNGFDWGEYLDLKPDRADKPNGRGIMMARMLCFDEMEYVGDGSEVICTVKNINKKSKVA